MNARWLRNCGLLTTLTVGSVALTMHAAPMQGVVSDEVAAGIFGGCGELKESDANSCPGTGSCNTTQGYHLDGNGDDAVTSAACGSGCTRKVAAVCTSS